MQKKPLQLKLMVDFLKEEQPWSFRQTLLAVQQSINACIHEVTENVSLLQENILSGKCLFALPHVAQTMHNNLQPT
jgi:hypothetical protein